MIVLSNGAETEKLFIESEVRERHPEPADHPPRAASRLARLDLVQTHLLLPEDRADAGRHPNEELPTSMAPDPAGFGRCIRFPVEKSESEHAIMCSREDDHDAGDITSNERGAMSSAPMAVADAPSPMKTREKPSTNASDITSARRFTAGDAPWDVPVPRISSRLTPDTNER